MIQLDTRPSFLKPAETKPQIKHEPVAVAVSHPTRRTLPDYPEYEFDPDGTPHRVSCTTSRGPTPAFGEVFEHNRQFSLRNKSGKRVSVSRTRIVEQLSGFGVAEIRKFTLDEFPNEYFDMAGNAFSILTDRPRRYAVRTVGQRDIKRFRLYHASTDRHAYISDVAIRRMRDGRSSYRNAYPPDGCKMLGSQYPDFCVDLYTGQPYRISSVRYSISEPIRIAPNADGSFNIRDFSGHRRTLSSHQLIELAS